MNIKHPEKDPKLKIIGKKKNYTGIIKQKSIFINIVTTGKLFWYEILN